MVSNEAPNNNMLKNYFTIAIRNISKHKFFSAINILGMTIGVTASLLIILWVVDELSFDRFHKDAERIYQVGLHGKLAGQDIRTATTCPPMAMALVSEFPEVEAATRVTPYYNEPVIRFDERVFTQDKVIFADSNFFDFFSFILLEGDAKTALLEPNSVVLTDATAQKYFGEEQALGKIISIDDPKKTYKVTGVAQTPPSNSHFDFNMIISSPSNERLKQNVWLNNWMYNYFKARPGADIKAVEAKFTSLVDKYIGPEMEKFVGVTMKQMKEQGGDYGYYTTRLIDIHLHSTSMNDLMPGGNMMHVYIFSGIGIFILLIACINFMNLSTARSAGRAKEVGLRKTLGSQRGQMIAQFLSESLIYSFIAVVFAIMACYSLLPSFNLISGKQLQLEVLTSPIFVAAILALIIFVGVIAGSYPAFYLTSFNAVEVLKGKVRAGMKSKGVRSLLVIFQFCISIFLIIFTLVIYEQIQYMHEQNIGLDKQNVLVVQNAYRLGDNKEGFRNSLVQQPGIEKISYTNNTFPGINNTTVFRAAGSEQDHIMGVYHADYDHLDVLRLELKEGRYFSKDFPSDSSAILLNEAAAREFGYDKPVGEEILYTDNSRTERLKVIGIIKNFNFESFKSQVRPISIRLSQNSGNLLVRYNGDAFSIIDQTEKLWKQHAPNEPFEYTFLDQEFDELFRAEQRMGLISTIFSGLAIFIACLGLFALAAFTSEQRTKEIGIRKALGATSFNLIVILSKEFTRLVLIAFLPAAAMGWYFADQWLSEFAHRISISPTLFIFSGLGAIVIAWLTVSYQAIKAAATNPVKSLRYE
jgi:putative ABC transport system permease protein